MSAETRRIDGLAAMDKNLQDHTFHNVDLPFIQKPGRRQHSCSGCCVLTLTPTIMVNGFGSFSSTVMGFSRLYMRLTSNKAHKITR